MRQYTRRHDNSGGGRARRARRLLSLTVVALVVATPAGADLGSRKEAVDSRLQALRAGVAAARRREEGLTGEIVNVTTQIRSLESRTTDVSTRLGTLQDDLALHERRLAKIRALLALQTRQVSFLRAEYASALGRLDARIVPIYEQDDPDTIDIILSSRSFQDLLDQLDYLGTIAHQDERIATQVGAARREMQLARGRTRRAQASVTAETRVMAYRAEQQAALRERLLASRRTLANARGQKQQSLAETRRQERDWTEETRSLAGVSSQLAAQIAAAQAAAAAPPPVSSAPSSPSAPAAAPTASSGLIWPVSGPITSPYGMRWGSLHPGIDIGAGMGTPIHAAATGRVLVASYSGGYGNLVVLDNGRGIATAYAHQSRIAVSVGQQVSQGQVIGYVGSTGFSTGPHLHFEVRVDGSTVDPMGYL